jgi:predicted phosphohydrolase
LWGAGPGSAMSANHARHVGDGPLPPSDRAKHRDHGGMRVWAISDLHLSTARPRDRSAYAARWSDHAAKIEAHWREAVGRDDLVLLPGDISTAGNHRDVQGDLAWLDRLPGTKVLGPGNHDRWWNGAANVRPMLRRSLRAVGGDAIAVDGVVVCGTMGAPPPRDPDAPDAASKEHWERELAALDGAFEAAKRIREPGSPLYVLWHFPPFDAHGRPTPAVPRIEAAGATACVFGHLHQQGQWATAAQGRVGGVRYCCVAADAIGFRPLRIDATPIVPRR